MKKMFVYFLLIMTIILTINTLTFAGEYDAYVIINRITPATIEGCNYFKIYNQGGEGDFYAIVESLDNSIVFYQTPRINNLPASHCMSFTYKVPNVDYKIVVYCYRSSWIFWEKTIVTDERYLLVN